MREIKYRVWDKENEVMLYSNDTEVNFVINTDNQLYVTASRQEYYEGGGEIHNRDVWEEVVFDEPMQFTGLKDKNGVEIYEGDLCFLFTDTPTEVIYKNGAFGYVSKGNEFISFAQNHWFQINNGVSEHIGKIGNIYENPELLKA